MTVGRSTSTCNRPAHLTSPVRPSCRKAGRADNPQAFLSPRTRTESRVMPVLTAAPPAAASPGPAELLRILKIEVPVIVKLAQRKVDVQEVLRLGPGSIIEFYKPSDEPLELMINNKT